MSQIIEGGRDNLEKKAAEIIKTSIDLLLKQQDYVVFAIPGGRSVSGIFGYLKEQDIPWEKVHLFMVDEREVPITDEQSNYRQARETFIDELVQQGKLPEDNVHPYKKDEGIALYQVELETVKQSDDHKFYDIVLLSSGEDGHIGALYPNHHSLEDGSPYFITMSDSPKPPPNRMSMSRQHLVNSRMAILLFFGKGKEDAYKLFKDGDIQYTSCSAKLVNELPTAYVLKDIE